MVRREEKIGDVGVICFSFQSLLISYLELPFLELYVTVKRVYLGTFSEIASQQTEFYSSKFNLFNIGVSCSLHASCIFGHEQLHTGVWTLQVLRWLVSLWSNFGLVGWLWKSSHLHYNLLALWLLPSYWHSLANVAKPHLDMHSHTQRDVLESIHMHTPCQIHYWQRKTRHMERQQRAGRKWKLKSQCQEEQLKHRDSLTTAWILLVILTV